MSWNTRRKRTLAFGAGAFALLAVLFVLGRAKRPPALPSDPDHRALAENLACVPCHGAGAPSPLTPAHPPKDDCLYCHRPVA